MCRLPGPVLSMRIGEAPSAWYVYSGGFLFTIITSGSLKTYRPSHNDVQLLARYYRCLGVQIQNSCDSGSEASIISKKARDLKIHCLSPGRGSSCCAVFCNKYTDRRSHLFIVVTGYVEWSAQRFYDLGSVYVLCSRKQGVVNSL